MAVSTADAPSLNGQHLTAQRDLAGHRDVGPHRYAGEQRHERGVHRDARRLAVLGHGARGDVDVEVDVLEEVARIEPELSGAAARR